MEATQGVPTREQIALEDTWNKESVFSGADAWEAEFDAVAKQLPSLETFSGKLSQDPVALASWFEDSSKLMRRVMKLYFYAFMSISVNSDDETAKAMVGRITGLYAQFAAKTAFAEPELLSMDSAKLQNWVSERDELATYAHYIDNLLRQKAHVRSAEVEEILGMLADPFQTVEQTAEVLTNNDMKFADAVGSDGTKATVTQGTRTILMTNPDREMRRTAWENFYDKHLEYKNTLANNYIASVKQNVFMAQVRGYDSALEAALAPYNIPVEVFHNLINTVKDNLPTWHRYWDVKRRALGLNDFRPYDVWAPVAEREPKISFDEAVDMIAKGMQPLGEDYVTILQSGCLEERWVDIYPNQGKRQGAFSFGSYDTHPFIMMSFDNGLSGMSTLAHELGHSMHSYYTRKHQPFVYEDYSMFVAEVASNFNQALVRAHLFANNDDRNFQLGLINEAMDNFHRYFFIMPTLARFEFEVHSAVEEGKPLTADILNKMMSDLYAEGYGDTMTDDPKRTGMTWATFGHLYVAFYTFQYATGISAAHALADGILNDADGAVDRYLSFLQAGNSMYPIDALDMAGVDMRTPEAVEKAFRVVEGLIDRLEQLTS